MMLLLNIGLNSVPYNTLNSKFANCVYDLCEFECVVFFHCKKPKIKHYLQINLRDKSGLGD